MSDLLIQTLLSELSIGARCTAPAPTTAERTDAASRWPLLAVLAVAQLMVILDISAVNVALPDMARDLSIARADVGWAITSYSLSSAACFSSAGARPICSAAAASS